MSSERMRKCKNERSELKMMLQHNTVNSKVQEMSKPTDFRILLVGRTGHGKSSTGNTIVGKDIFKVSEESKSLTKTCQWSKKFERFGKRVEVVDTPGFFDTDSDQSNVHKELLKALVLTTPGFHVIAFVLMKSRFTEEIQKTQDLFFKWFGPGVEKFACVILTNTKSDEAKKRYINNDPHLKLAELVETCNGNVVAMNNLASNEEKEIQVRSLFQVVESIKQSNKDEHFTNVAFQLAESYAMNKYPKELTNGSIVILQKAGLGMELSGNQCKYLDYIFKLLDGDEKDDTSTDGGAQTYGNLLIIDSSTNQRIHNTQKVKPSVRINDPTSNPSMAENVTDAKASDFQTLTGETESEPFNQVHDSGSDQTENRFDIPTTPVEKMQDEANHDKNSEELKGFSGHLKKAWEYSKRKVRGCIIL